MIKQIRCTTCDTVLGIIEKDVISQDDIDLYKLMMECPNNHGYDVNLGTTPIELEEAEA